MRLIILFLLVLISSPLISYGGTRDPKESDKTHVEYADKTDYIVKLWGKDKDNRTLCASAVLIKPNWILTAAHVVKDNKEFSIIVQSKKHSISKVICHKDFQDNNFGYHDIALGYLDEATALDFYPELYTDSNEESKQAYICGFGLTGTFSSGANTDDGNKRAGTNIIDRIERTLLICSINTGVRTKYEFLIANGDSGGGLFINNKLAGINSCVIAEDKLPNSDYGDESGHTRVSEYIQWIKEHTDDQKK